MKRNRLVISFVLSILMLVSVFSPAASALSVHVGSSDVANPTVYSKTVFADNYESELDSKEAVQDPIFLYSGPTYTSHADVVEFMRSSLANHTDSFTIRYTLSNAESLKNSDNNSSSEIEKIADGFILDSMAHTGNAKEGDYISLNYSMYNYRYIWYYDESTEEIVDIVVEYNFEYYTTAEQEKTVDDFVKTFIDSYITSDMTDLQKVKMIYDFICSTVVYDNEHLNDKDYTLKLTAYAAIVNGTAVCQGYATLFYRIALDCGVDCRVITGDAHGAHAWNIVKLDGRYYYLDSTWDSSVEGDYYLWFLRGSENFTEHTSDDSFTTTEFTLTYPISEKDYQIHVDENGDNICDYCGGCFEHKYEVVVINPTCLDYGYTVHTCLTCKYTYEDSYKPELGHNYKDNVCLLCGCIESGYTGLAKVDDTWRYAENGMLVDNYTGLANNAYGTWYVKNGVLNKATGLIKMPSTSLQKANTWVYIENGKFTGKYTGMAKNQYGWYYVKNSVLDTSYTGMAKNDYGWWYMKNGKLDTSYTGMAKNDYGWWYMKNGKLDTSYTGMAKNEYGWWHMTKGKLDTSYTGIDKNQYGSWYMKNGKLQSNYTGKVTISGKTYNIKNGKVV